MQKLIITRPLVYARETLIEVSKHLGIYSLSMPIIEVKHKVNESFLVSLIETDNLVLTSRNAIYAIGKQGVSQPLLKSILSTKKVYIIGKKGYEDYSSFLPASCKLHFRDAEAMHQHLLATGDMKQNYLHIRGEEYNYDIRRLPALGRGKRSSISLYSVDPIYQCKEAKKRFIDSMTYPEYLPQSKSLWTAEKRYQYVFPIYSGRSGQILSDLLGEYCKKSIFIHISKRCFDSFSRKLDGRHIVAKDSSSRGIIKALADLYYSYC